MRNFNRLAKLFVVSALAVTCLPTLASAATQTRSFYQNASASCAGSSPLDEDKLERTPQRLKNISGADADVVCSLATDIFAVPDAIYGVVSYVAMWAKISAPGPVVPLKKKPLGAPASTDFTCILVTGFAGDPDGETLVNSYNNGVDPGLPANGNQGYVEFIAASPAKFRAPVNLNCILHPGIEMNDWIVIYDVEVGA
jgi:hypothetical protein